jgi:hypothetical protein
MADHLARIQLIRRRGWRLPPGAVPAAQPGRFGNPFAVTRRFARADPLRPCLEAAVLEVTGVDADQYDPITPGTAAATVAAYRLWLADQPELIATARAQRHASVLLKVANAT